VLQELYGNINELMPDILQTIQSRERAEKKRFVRIGTAFFLLVFYKDAGMITPPLFTRHYAIHD
jgi:hypothetical protein